MWTRIQFEIWSPRFTTAWVVSQVSKLEQNYLISLSRSSNKWLKSKLISVNTIIQKLNITISSSCKTVWKKKRILEYWFYYLNTIRNSNIRIFVNTFIKIDTKICKQVCPRKKVNNYTAVHFREVITNVIQSITNVWNTHLKMFRKQFQSASSTCNCPRLERCTADLTDNINLVSYRPWSLPMQCPLAETVYLLIWETKLSVCCTVVKTVERYQIYHQRVLECKYCRRA